MIVNKRLFNRSFVESFNINIFPNTGVTLPLVSMGGSSFLFTCLSIGIILSVARNVEQLEGEKTAVVETE